MMFHLRQVLWHFDGRKVMIRLTRDGGWHHRRHHCCAGGGYVISPLQPQGGFHERSLVKHMLMVDWKDWKAFWVPSRNRDMTLCMLERVAGNEWVIREF